MKNMIGSGMMAKLRKVNIFSLGRGGVTGCLGRILKQGANTFFGLEKGGKYFFGFWNRGQVSFFDLEKGKKNILLAFKKEARSFLD